MDRDLIIIRIILKIDLLNLTYSKKSQLGELVVSLTVNFLEQLTTQYLN